MLCIGCLSKFVQSDSALISLYLLPEVVAVLLLARANRGSRRGKCQGQLEFLKMFAPNTVLV